MGHYAPLSHRQQRRRCPCRNLRQEDTNQMAAPVTGNPDYLGGRALFMLDSLPIMLLIGCALGFLSGIGVGGGSLLILWLSLVLSMDHSVARSINLLFFIPSAVIASIFRWKQGSLNVRKILPAIIAGCIAAAIFSLVGKQLDTIIIKKLFGGLLLITGIREICYRERKAR